MPTTTDNTSYTAHFIRRNFIYTEGVTAISPKEALSSLVECKIEVI
ncbi:MAG: hypothetical protein DDT33_01260 [Firmicutes bacterium]|nr:hypothetical protein [Bacillota bacterium]